MNSKWLPEDSEAICKAKTHLNRRENAPPRYRYGAPVSLLLLLLLLLVLLVLLFLAFSEYMYEAHARYQSVDLGRRAKAICIGFGLAGQRQLTNARMTI